MTQHVMVDLETLGTGNNAVLLSLGACWFEPHGNGILDSFYVRIDPASCQRAGLVIDADTVMWWLDPLRQDARAALFAGPMVDLVDALYGFQEWVRPHASIAVWGNGATFDNVLLRNAYRAANMDCPWPFFMDRCYRTVKSMAGAAPIEIERNEGVHHDALADAVAQALHLQRIVQHMGLVV